MMKCPKAEKWLDFLSKRLKCVSSTLRTTFQMEKVLVLHSFFPFIQVRCLCIISFELVQRELFSFRRISHHLYCYNCRHLVQFKYFENNFYFCIQLQCWEKKVLKVLYNDKSEQFFVRRQLIINCRLQNTAKNDETYVQYLCFRSSIYCASNKSCPFLYSWNKNWWDFFVMQYKYR